MGTKGDCRVDYNNNIHWDTFSWNEIQDSDQMDLDPPQVLTRMYSYDVMANRKDW